MTDTEFRAHASPAGTVIIGDRPVNRLGFGTMQLCGPGIWDEPQDRDRVLAVLRTAVDLGVNFIDTADSYGPFVAEDLIREALYPYPQDLSIATKGGLLRRGPVGRDEPWPVDGRPEYLRQCVEMSLRRLRVDTIDLYQLHRIDPLVPVEDSLGELAAMRQEGKIAEIGVSEVDLPTLRRCQAVTPIATVQNRYNLLHRVHDPVLDHCADNDLTFIPWDPLASGDLLLPDGPLAGIARDTGHSPAHLAISWLLKRSPAMLVIPGTSSPEHVADNIRAAAVDLPADSFDALTRLTAH